MAASKRLDKFLDETTAAPEAPPHLKVAQREIKDLKRKLALNESGADIIIQTVREIFGEEPPEYEVPPCAKQGKKDSSEIAVLHLSDLQIGKTTTSYDTAVAHERLRLVGQKAVEIIGLRQKIARVDELHLLLGGDLIEGERIFATQAHEIDTPLIRQACIDAPNAILSVIRSLLPMVPKIHVHSVRGNHGRDDHESSPATNWDTVVGLVLEQMAKPCKGRVTFNIAIEDWKRTFTTYGWRHLLCHGHQIRGMLGFPWYGFGKKTQGWYQTVEPYDFVWTGHFHTAAAFVINNIMCLANGTTESDNAYAQEELAAGGHPCQRLAMFNESHGLIADMLLHLGERRPNNQMKPTIDRSQSQ